MQEIVARWRPAGRLLLTLLVAGWGGACAAVIDPGAIQDAETVARAKTALVNDEVLGARAIEVRVMAGVAVLTGRVASGDEHARAVRVVRAVPGVSDVDGSGLLVGDVAPSDAVPVPAAPVEAAVEGEDAGRRPGVFALGAAVATSRPTGDSLEERWTVGPLFRIGRGEGLGVAVGFNWFRAGLGAESAARVRVRPIMAGVGYTVRRDRLAVATSLVGGYAFNSLSLADVTVPGAPVPVAVDNSFAWRPSVSVWHDLGERTALNVSLGYVLTGLDVTYLEAGRLETRDVSGNTAIVQVGLAYTLF
jgi:hypothetical protein